MSVARALFLNRIGGQMALLILAALVVIHATITATIFLSHRFEGAHRLEESPGDLVALVRLVAASHAGSERTLLLTQIANAAPQLDLKPAQVMPPAGASEDPRLRFLAERLGPGFAIALMPTPQGAPQTLALRLPDGALLSANLPDRHRPPFPGGPLTFTLLFVIVSVTLLALWATRALRTPLSGFAKAAESFSLDGRDAALPERGPEEVRAVARAFNRMRERIRKLVDDRTRLLAAMGHDLRTPITRLRLRSEFIADAELRAQMLRDLDQMKAMTDDVLSFLRDGEKHEAATSVDVASLLQTVCDGFADMGHNVVYEGPAHLAVRARPDDLQRAIANLADNAVRHGQRVGMRLTATEIQAVIEVADDGPGIPDERKAAMLEAFVRGEDARTMDDHAGFGLGLSIARAVAEAHGGALTLGDRVPHGLIARIVLPRG
ncbi:MAG TPA: ATP-binding protein [Pseudolabrys sp.]|nr:ATP-binding protein [Pseudolabrys sp.]